MSGQIEYCFLLTGLAKSGKSTIERIVFRDTSRGPEGAADSNLHFLTIGLASARTEHCESKWLTYRRHPSS